MKPEIDKELPVFRPENLPVEERIAYHIYHLRNSAIGKEWFGIRYNLPKILISLTNYTSRPIPDFSSSSNIYSLMMLSDTSILSILTLLGDRRPIVVTDHDKIPARFYRYQDAAVDILGYINFAFHKQDALKPSSVAQPVIMPGDEYFEYQPSALLKDKASFILRRLGIPEDQYFSEYLEKQTPQERQNTIDSIKKWVEETLANSIKPEAEPK
jgi:hypothetical protein